MSPSWVYILTNRSNGILYTGMTTDLIKQIYQQNGLKRLVYYEEHSEVLEAIQREKNIKHWPRAWKARLILEFNPSWTDLYDSLHP